jgi:hypothetical protein
MSLRLSGDAGGDLPDLPPCARESPCERSNERNYEIEKKCETTDPTDSQDPLSLRSKDFPGTRKRLREIIKNSPNPRKMLSYFHSKFTAFLRHGIKVERLWPQPESEQRGSFVDDKGPTLSAPTEASFVSSRPDRDWDENPVDRLGSAPLGFNPCPSLHRVRLNPFRIISRPDSPRSLSICRDLKHRVWSRGSNPEPVRRAISVSPHLSRAHPIWGSCRRRTRQGGGTAAAGAEGRRLGLS